LNSYYEQIVVGSSLRAVLFAALNDFPVFFTKPEKPFEFDYFDPSIDLSSWGLHNELQLWTTPNGEKKTGQNKIALWEHVFFVLGLKGLTPFSDFCSSLRIDDNTLTGYSEYAKLRSVDFGVCHYFDDHASYNLLPSENTPKTYNVYDRFAFIRGGKHHLDLIEDKDHFCNKIWFYPSPRLDGETLIKDACVLSILSDDQIDDFDFSETLVRLTTLQKMKDLGLRGPKNGKQADGSQRYRSFKAQAINRTKFLISPPLWLETDTIKVPQIAEADLVKDLGRIAENNKRILNSIWLNT
jgi:hypothetical protein|tara:strand:+ start:1360 stop:2250 length:891 start_codon:yes stop_codon:yes gene_type:complete